MCSNNAAFVITLAAVRLISSLSLSPLFFVLLSTNPCHAIQEMFIQHLAEEAHTQAKLERKPRRNIQYKDVGKSHLTHSNPPLPSHPTKKKLTSKKPTQSHTATTSNS